jgi:hypothetical protein
MAAALLVGAGAARESCADPAMKPRVDVAALIRQSVDANNRNWAAAPGYQYLETDRLAGGSETYRVRMLYGSPYNELVAVNGRGLPPDRQSDEQRKLQQAIARRKAETPAQHAERVSEYEKGRTRDHILQSQLANAFDFHFIAQQNLDGRAVYELQATPRADYRPLNRDARVLTGMEGKLWIDVKTDQWVQVQARVIHPVAIVGFLAVVEPGTRFALQYASVGDGIWMPTRFLMKSRARVLYFFSHRDQADETYSDYRP